MYYTKPEVNHRRRTTVLLSPQQQRQQTQQTYQQQLFSQSWCQIKWGSTMWVFLAMSVGMTLSVLRTHSFDQETDWKPELVAKEKSNDVPHLEREQQRTFDQQRKNTLRNPINRWTKSNSLLGLERADPSKRLEFVHITKTGGSAVEMGAAAGGVRWGVCHYVQVPYLGCNWTADWEFPESLNMPNHLKNKTHSEPWHSPPHWLVPNPHQQQKSRIATFVVVRDPYQRIFSEFYCSSFGFNGTVSAHSLNAWIVEKLTEDTPYYGHLLPQHYYVFHHETGFRIVDHVLRYEALDTQFPLLMKSYRLKVELPQKTSSQFVMSVEQASTRLNMAHLTDDTIRLINEYYRQDFESFGYGMVVTE